jgi:hypothetical protein
MHLCSATAMHFLSAVDKRDYPKMYLTSEIVKDTLAARRFRMLAPLAVLLALAALTLAPAIIGY